MQGESFPVPLSSHYVARPPLNPPFRCQCAYIRPNKNKHRLEECANQQTTSLLRDQIARSCFLSFRQGTRQDVRLDWWSVIPCCGRVNPYLPPTYPPIGCGICLRALPSARRCFASPQIAREWLIGHWLGWIGLLGPLFIAILRQAEKIYGYPKKRNADS